MRHLEIVVAQALGIQSLHLRKCLTVCAGCFAVAEAQMMVSREYGGVTVCGLQVDVPLQVIVTHEAGRPVLHSEEQRRRHCEVDFTSSHGFSLPPTRHSRPEEICCPECTIVYEI